MSDGITLDGKSKDHNFVGIHFYPKESLLGELINWGEIESDEIKIVPIMKYFKLAKTFKYSRTIILGICNANKLDVLMCGTNGPKEAIRYLYEEFLDESSDEIEKRLIQLMSRFHPSYFMKEDVMVPLIHLMLKTRLAYRYLTHIMSATRPQSEQCYGIPEGTEAIIAEYLSCFPWDDIKKEVEFVIERSPMTQYRSWLLVYRESKFTDIAHKVIEL